MRRKYPPISVLIGGPVLLTVGCGDVETPLRSLTVAEAKSCVESGGIVEQVSMSERTACVRLFADRGKWCTKRSDCTGECRFADDNRPLHLPGRLDGPHTKQPREQWDILPPVGAKVIGRCQWSSNPSGCRAVVSNGRLEMMECWD